MLPLLPLISDARKKIGGTVFARNRSGLYARALVQPAQPRTPSQVGNRNQFATLASGWKTLDQTEIEAWGRIAQTITHYDSLGHPYHPSGYTLWMSCGKNLALLGLPRPAVPPVIHLLPPRLIIESVAPTTIAGTLTTCLATRSLTSPGDTSTVVVYATPPQSLGVNFCGPRIYRQLLNVIQPDTDTLQLAPSYIALFGQPPLGKRIFFKFRKLDPDTGFATIAQPLQAIVSGT